MIDEFEELELIGYLNNVTQPKRREYSKCPIKLYQERIKETNGQWKDAPF